MEDSPKFTVRQYDVVQVYLADLKPDPDNPNVMSKDQKAGLNKGMQRFGFLVPIIFDQNNIIIDGHNRVEEMRNLGMETAPAYRVQLKDGVERRMLRQMLNQLHGMNDPKKYALELRAIFEGGRLDELAQLIAKGKEELQHVLEKHQGMSFVYEDKYDPRKQPKGPVVTKPGDLWILGQHRLLCADNTKPGVLNTLLLPNEYVDQFNCDPPYGVDYVEKNEFLNEIDAGNRVQIAYANDGADLDYRKIFAELFRAIPFADYNTIYIWSGGYNLHKIREAMEDAGITWSDYLCWVKDRHVLGRKDYNAQMEWCIYGWKKHHKFYGPFRTNVLFHKKPLVNDLHPTMKPVELIAQTITDGTAPGAVVLDIYGGSGTSLIACEQTGRIWRGTEIVPYFCDVIVNRWQALTGKVPQRIEASATA